MKRLCILSLVIAAFVSGCTGTKKIYIGPKIQVSSIEKEIIEVKGPVSVAIENESGNMDIYLWDENSVKFEITKRYKGIGEKGLLAKKLDDIDYSISYDEKDVVIKSDFKKGLENPSDERLDMCIYLPYSVKGMKMKIGTGRVKIHDSLECSLAAEVEMANFYVNKFEGILDYQADMGNLNIRGGKVFSGSKVKINMGNIDINAAYDPEGVYSFKTNIGNINITAPGNSGIEFASTGNVKVNEFNSSNQPVIVNLASDMGEISIRKSN